MTSICVNHVDGRNFIELRKGDVMLEIPLIGLMTTKVLNDTGYYVTELIEHINRGLEALEDD